MAEREKLSSRLGFILLSAGCAIGLGNVWRFPYITGQYGGAAFVILYLVFLLLIGLPVMTMEFSIGRASRKNIVGAYRTLEPQGSKWHIAGPLAYAGNYLLLMFYTNITGWLLYYCLKCATGTFSGAAVNTVSATFSALMASPAIQTVFMFIALGITALIVLGGLQKGVEKITKTMMLILLALMIVLAIRSCFLDGASAGLEFYLKPDFGKLHENGLFNAIFAAMGQAFFTLSLGIGAMAIFGSYFSSERSLSGETVKIMALDTTVALLSGLIIFPACFAYGVEAGSGPGLLFLSLPEVFAKMAGGRFWGAVFFLAMAFAALSTLIAVFENIVSYWIDIKGLQRKKAVLLNFILLFVLSIPCVLGFNVLSGFQPLGEGSTVLDLEDFLVSNIILPLGSLVMVFFCTQKIGWGWKNFLTEADKGEGMKFPSWLRVYCKWILPLIIIFVFVVGLWQILA